jgi:peptide/nickel transport system substrate-binding protein
MTFRHSRGRLTRRALLRYTITAGLSMPALAVALTASAAAAAATAAAWPTSALAQDQVGQGGTVVIGVYQEANSLSPVLVGTPVSFAFMELSPMFEPMLRVNGRLEPEPALLTEVPTTQNGGISPDGRTVTLRMRPDLTWEDGQPCTIRDWIFTWQWIMDPKNRAPNTSGWKEIDTATASDDTTAVVTLRRLYLPFVAETLAGWPIVPEHIQSKMSSEDFGRKPVGNGPFKFVEWISGDHITLAQNPRYWRDPKPHLDKLIFKIVPDRNTVIAQAKTGDIDIGVDYTEAQIPEMSNVPNVALMITTPPIYERYHFTMVTADDVTKPHPIFGDIRVRKALTLAVDRQSIIDSVLFGKAKVAKNELDNTPYENTSIVIDRFDPDQAKQMLDEAGWKPGPDGIRMKDGIRLSFTNGTTSGNQTRETIQVLVQANFKDVGAEMTIANAPASTFFGGYAQGAGFLARKLDMVGFTNGIPGIDPNLRAFWHSGAVPTNDHPTGYNSSGLSDPNLDKLLDDQLTELDTNKRTELLKMAQQIIHDDYPTIPLYDRVTINSVSGRVRGVNPISFGSVSGLVWNTHEWSVN